MPVQELIHGALRTASRAVEAGRDIQSTARVESVRRGVETEQHDSAGEQTQERDQHPRVRARAMDRFNDRRRIHESRSCEERFDFRLVHHDERPDTDWQTGNAAWAEAGNHRDDAGGHAEAEILQIPQFERTQ